MPGFLSFKQSMAAAHALSNFITPPITQPLDAQHLSGAGTPLRSK